MWLGPRARNWVTSGDVGSPLPCVSSTPIFGPPADPRWHSQGTPSLYRQSPSRSRAQFNQSSSCSFSSFSTSFFRGKAGFPDDRSHSMASRLETLYIIRHRLQMEWDAELAPILGGNVIPQAPRPIAAAPRPTALGRSLKLSLVGLVGSGSLRPAETRPTGTHCRHALRIRIRTIACRLTLIQEPSWGTKSTMRRGETWDDGWPIACGGSPDASRPRRARPGQRGQASHTEPMEDSCHGDSEGRGARADPPSAPLD